MRRFCPSATVSRASAFVAVAVTLASLLAGCAGASRVGGHHAATVDQVLRLADGDRIQADVTLLASARLRGRATGTRELIEASEYVRDGLIAAGMRPAVGDTSYFQHYRVDFNEILTPARLEAVIAGETRSYTLLEEFLPHPNSGSGTFASAAVVVMDSSAAERGFEGAVGKAVVYLPPRIYEADPDMNAFDARRLPVVHVIETARALAAAGARALILPGDSYGRIGTDSVEGLPIVWLAPDEVARLTAAADQERTDLRLSGSIRTTLHRNRDALNVLAMQPGMDPTLADEAVIVCAHTDHVGTIAGEIFYGAHDNASGTAVMMEVARLVREAVDRGLTPRRRILFAGFSGEEMALLGSRHYVESEPVVPLDRTTAVLNLDIVGGGNGFMMVGALTWPNFYALAARINDDRFGFELRQRDNAPNSDHFFFGYHGVPAAFYYGLDGPPVGIHTPTDTADKMEPEFMANAARFAFATVWELANLDPSDARRLREPGQ